MKRLFLAWLMMLCLLPMGAWAEDTPGALYPIRENGLWGYMNRAGEVVMEPQWAVAEPFRGQYAVVYPGTDDPEVDPEEYCGIIDICGHWVLEPDCRKILSKDNDD